jgi:hypothetical protein
LILLCLLAVLFLPFPVHANGGEVQLARHPAGPYELTVSTSPSPVRTGIVDVSVLVERAGAGEVVYDARVLVTAEPVDQPGPAGRFEATRERATNKLFYAADVSLPTEGRWRIGVQVAGPLGEGVASFEVEASRPTLLDRLLDNLLQVVVLLLALAAAASWWRRPARR